jgi:putative endopeptidase
MKRKSLIFAPAVVLAVLIILSFNPLNPPVNTGKKGVDPAFFDTTVKPVNDFYQFANGRWLNTTEIPGTHSTWGSFAQMREDNLEKLRTLLEEIAFGGKPQNDPDLKKLGDYFASGMDSTKRNEDALEGLKPEREMIMGMKSSKDVPSVLGKLHFEGMRALFGIYVDQDLKNSEEMVTTLFQGGLGLPDRDYYTRMDDEAQVLRKKYVQYIMDVFENAGVQPKEIVKASRDILAFETRLADASYTNVERRNIKIQYNRMSTDSLQKLCPGLDWKKYLEAVGFSQTPAEIVVSNPKFMVRVSELLEQTDPGIIKNYLWFHSLNSCAMHLDADMEQKAFEFYEKTLRGTKTMSPRWKKVIESADHAMGDALGKAFVARHFSPVAKKKVNEMADYLFVAYRERINSRTWMSEPTKKAALAKLDAIIRKLGYPDKWKDYGTMKISRDSYVRNYIQANMYESKRVISKLGKPVDKTEWGMTPPTINAYYNPSINEIVFPAGIMQYPFFDADMDDAVNFGAMGGVIGHELTHGFDDQGAQFDGKGNFTMWWSEEDFSKFEMLAGKVVTQFNGYLALDTLRVNGKLTLGENIADLGGLTMAYYAYKKFLEKNPAKKKEKIHGLSPEQRFFIGWARVWCIKHRPEALKQRLITDVHAPGKFRVNGPLSNMKEFYDAFGVKQGDAMWRDPKDRIEIW